MVGTISARAASLRNSTKQNEKFAAPIPRPGNFSMVGFVRKKVLKIRRPDREAFGVCMNALGTVTFRLSRRTPAGQMGKLDQPVARNPISSGGTSVLIAVLPGRRKTAREINAKLPPGHRWFRGLSIRLTPSAL